MFSVLSTDGNTQLVIAWLRTLSSEAVKIAALISYQSVKKAKSSPGIGFRHEAFPVRAWIQANVGVLPGAHMGQLGVQCDRSHLTLTPPTHSGPRRGADFIAGIEVRIGT